VTEKEKVLNYLRDAGGSLSRSEVSIQVFRRNLSAHQLDTLLNTVLAGLVEVRDKRWTLTDAGWREANLLTSPQDSPEPQETISDGFARFRSLARENPDASLQRLLQLAGRSLGDPLEWGTEWQQARPEWYLQSPRDWYSRDVELDSDGYPLRLPDNPLTTKEQNTRPTTERAWFEWTTRQSGASLQPLAVEMPAFEVANILRTCRKIGENAATEIFGPAKIETARELATI
jgi:hypothetical protein